MRVGEMRGAVSFGCLLEEVLDLFDLLVVLVFGERLSVLLLLFCCCCLIFLAVPMALKDCVFCGLGDNGFSCSGVVEVFFFFSTPTE